ETEVFQGEPFQAHLFRGFGIELQDRDPVAEDLLRSLGEARQHHEEDRRERLCLFVAHAFVLRHDGLTRFVRVAREAADEIIGPRIINTDLEALEFRAPFPRLSRRLEVSRCAASREGELVKETAQTARDHLAFPARLAAYREAPFVTGDGLVDAAAEKVDPSL